MELEGGQTVLSVSEVDMVTGDQCVCRLKTWGVNGEMEACAKKGTSCVSNSQGT